MVGNQYYVGRYKQEKKKESSWRGRDAVRFKINTSNNLYANSQYPFTASHAFLDSVATDNYGNNQIPINNKVKLNKVAPIHLTNGSTMTPTHKGILPNLPDISERNKTCQTCSTSSGPALISLGKLCDDKCIAVCDHKKCIVCKNKPILRANRCQTTGMYVTDLNNPTLELPRIKQTYNQIDQCTSLHEKIELVHANLQQFTSIERLVFLHGALGFPPISTLRRAIIAGYLLSFPDLTEKNVSKLPTQDTTVLGHMDQKRKNVQSTKSKPEEDEWTLTLKTHCPAKTQEFYHNILNLNNTIYTDQTGKFNVRSIRGYQYILITYSYDANAILVRPLWTRKGIELLDAIKEIHTYLIQRGFQPKHQILDNEASLALKTYLKTKLDSFQFVPPHLHRRNAAERAIRTFKNHFISILCRVHHNFPIYLWCKLLP